VNRSVLGRRAAPAAVALALSLGLAACGGGDAGESTSSSGGEGEALSGSINVDGSSTVFPLSEAAAELFQEEQPDVQVTVGQSGTGGGFQKFCNGETDISNASRPIKDEEIAACEANGITYQELHVANDALTVVVNTENDWATCLTVEQLTTIWAPGSTVNNWNQVDPSFPDQAMQLFGPGTDSGTFDYFTAEINGEEGASRTDYSPSEDDNVTVQGVSGSPGGLGYFGYTYFEENADNLTAVEIDSGDGCVAPSAETAQDGTYTPLSRPLFIYPSAEAASSKPEVQAFIDFYVESNQTIAEEALFIPLNSEQETALQDAAGELGSGAGASAEPTSS
jgi:phosphate transport system substrate-binding protein